MFSVTHFVLSKKKKIVIKRFALNIVLLKKWFSSSYVENAMKNAMRSERNQQWNNAIKKIQQS